ncbi:hypothetical protein K440DRAFT_624821, partial [Wilcoxina mikolae CBS 423.85]
MPAASEEWRPPLWVGGLMLKPLLAQPLPLCSSYILLSLLQISSRSSSNLNSNLSSSLSSGFSSNSNSRFTFGRRRASVWPCPPIRFHWPSVKLNHI